MVEKKVIKIEKTNKVDTNSDKPIRTIGRRKSACARVRLQMGTGEFIVNGKPLKIYFGAGLHQDEALSPLIIVGKEKKFDVSVVVAGGGTHSQAQAIRHGIARALVHWDDSLKASLKVLGLLTRDPREKERKKAGLYKARRAHQWRKR